MWLYCSSCCATAAVKSLSAHHHSAGYIFISFEIIQPTLVILKNRIPLKPALGGAYAASQTTVLHMKRTQSNRVSDFHDFVCSLFPKTILFDSYLKRTLASSVDPDQSPHNAASDQGLHCLHYLQAF